MTPAGYSGTPLPKKLGIREGSRVGTRHAPAHLPALLAPLPTDSAVDPLDTAAHRAGEARFDVLMLFTDDEGVLHDELDALPERLEIDGGLWVCWPKMKSPLFRELREAHVRAAGLDAGLVDNKICAIDDDWSGLRFVYRRDDRPAVLARRGDTE